MKWFDISNELRMKLVKLQDEHANDEIVKSQKAVVMFDGFGDGLYLTLDGRVIVDDLADRLDDKPSIREAKSFAEAAMAIVLGSETRNLPELLKVLPKRPNDALDCENCNSSGWFQPIPTLGPFVCGECGGLGWKVAEGDKFNSVG